MVSTLALLVALGFSADATVAPKGGMAEDFIAVSDIRPEFEVPPVMGVDAHGSSGVRYDADSGVLSWVIEYTGLTSTPSGAHIHGPATPDNNADIIVDLLANSPSAESPIVGSVMIDATTAAIIASDLSYINLHTTANSSGEARGQQILLGDETFEASLDPDQESHEVVDADDATGRAVFRYDLDRDRLSWVIDYSGLTDTPTGGHIHAPADPGVNAGVVLDLLVNSQGSESPIVGRITGPDPELLGFMFAQRGYVNLHTPTNSAGEVRGQLAPIVFTDGFEGEPLPSR